MAYFMGTTSGYRDLLAKLVEFATNDNVQSVAVNAGGSGYVVGDILTISGGTSTVAAQVEVLAVSSGAVTEAIVINGGAYTADPTLSGASTTGGSGSGCTLDITMQVAAWATERYAEQISVITVDSIVTPGSGYMVNDIVTIDSSGDGATSVVTEATFRVTSVGGSGEVTGLSVETQGEYTANSTGVAIATTGGTGSGLTIDPGFTGYVSEDQAILSSTGAVTAYVGVRTFSVSGIGASNWELAAMSDFTSTLNFASQPGISPGRWDASDTGCYTPMRNTTMNYWLSITDRMIKLFIQTGSNYHQAIMGLLDSYATDTEYPYPIIVMGTSSIHNVEATTSDIGLGGFPDPISEDENDTNGPGVLRRANGVWTEIRNGYKSSSTTLGSQANGAIAWPGPNIGTIAPSLDDSDDWVSSGISAKFDGDFIERPVGATPSARLEPTPGSGDSLTPLFPITLAEFSQSALYGEVPGLFWASTSRDGSSSAVSNDTFKVGTRRFRIFQNVGRTEIYNFCCMEEA